MICELHFRGSDWDETVPGQFYERVKDRFPAKDQLAQLTIELKGPSEAPSAEVKRDEPRIRFWSDDRSRLVQIGRDVLVLNQLRPYPGFEAWKPIVSSMRAVYSELARPRQIAKLGLRYLNRVNIGKASFQMEDYFRLYPLLPEEMGGEHGAFLLRFEARPKLGGHRLVISLGSTEPSAPGRASMLLDLFDTVALPSNGLEPWEQKLDEAHDNVVAAFEGAITDRSRALFDSEEPT